MDTNNENTTKDFNFLKTKTLDIFTENDTENKYNQDPSENGDTDACQCNFTFDHVDEVNINYMNCQYEDNTYNVHIPEIENYAYTFEQDVKGQGLKSKDRISFYTQDIHLTGVEDSSVEGIWLIGYDTEGTMITCSENCQKYNTLKNPY